MKRTYTPVKKKTVLIVDDDQVVVQIYRAKIEGRGFKVEVASNGESARQKLKKSLVDLLILDLLSPGMNGVEVLKQIRSEFDAQTLPIIVFSNPYLGKLERAALDAGATKSVMKAEATPDQMLQLVLELLSAGPPRPDDGAPQVVGSGSESGLAEEIRGAFLINVPKTLAKLRSAHQGFAKTQLEDLKLTELAEMHREVRSLAGPASILGFLKIAQMANALEALLIELHGQPKKITPSVIRTIAQAIDTLASLFGRDAKSQAELETPARILVVDDDLISRDMVCAALAKANLAAIGLDDSLTAERLLKQEHFDLVFLDVEMPGQTGLELCVKIRQMNSNRSTPVVFVTAHSDFGSRAQSSLSGGNDFIAKPFLSVELGVKALAWLLKEKAPLVAGIDVANIHDRGLGSRLEKHPCDKQLVPENPHTQLVL